MFGRGSIDSTIVTILRFAPSPFAPPHQNCVECHGPVGWKCRSTTSRSQRRLLGRGLHSSTFQLNLSDVYGIGGARRGCVARVKGVLGVCRVFLCVRHGSS
jgi:hypothetical protein